MVNNEIEIKKAPSEFTDDIDWLSKQSYETVDIVSYDGLKLKGYYLSAESPSMNTVILSHGYSSKGLWMAYMPNCIICWAITFLCLTIGGMATAKEIT